MKKRLLTLFFATAVLSALAIEPFSPLSVAVGEKAEYPASNGNVYGLRLALISGAHARMIGLSCACIANNDFRAQGYVGGFQAAAIANAASSGEFGVWQAAVGWNDIREGGNGFQLAAGCNLSGTYFNGAQLAAVNVASQDLTGMQIGLYNSCGSVLGFQLGLVNHAKNLAGLQLGLLNLVESSAMDAFPLVRIGW